ncbi:hypothetical protein SEPB62_19026 [Salmonella enterica subsp. enterica serovar Paratyphi B str. SARA62]|nr:hypothetical protein SEPB62_19026 [Salmonella enterica subsp. enterica serovar Paratyphi B str. SARA62]ESF86665.1 hypothetical protein SEEPB585_04186 [Salmonella enterica subsp. enterica serovar Paratyphi B str. ATCC BAA-1585]
MNELNLNSAKEIYIKTLFRLLNQATDCAEAGRIYCMVCEIIKELN